MQRAGLIQPRFVVKAHHVHHQSVTFPAAHRMSRIGWLQIFGMLDIERNNSEHVHVFIENHDLFGRLVEAFGTPAAAFEKSAGELAAVPGIGEERARAIASFRGWQAVDEEMSRADKGEQFDILKGSLTGEDELPRQEIAARLDMSEGTVKVAVHRLRLRYRALLRAAIAETVSNEADLDDEVRYLVEVLRKR